MSPLHDRSMTPYAALHRARDRAQPFITWYDDAQSFRVELSLTTLLNGIAKCSGLLRDEYDVMPGDVVALRLPMHWQRAVWLGACWSVGAVAAPDHVGPARLAIVPEGESTQSAADEILPVDLGPLSLPARHHPDTFTPFTMPQVDQAAMLLSDGTVLDAGEVMSVARVLADAWRVPEGGRLLAIDPVPDVHTGLDSAAGWLACLAVPLVVDGSVVVVSHEDPATRDARVDSERVTAVARGQ